MVPIKRDSNPALGQRKELWLALQAGITSAGRLYGPVQSNYVIEQAVLQWQTLEVDCAAGHASIHIGQAGQEPQIGHCLPFHGSMWMYVGPTLRLGCKAHLFHQGQTKDPAIKLADIFGKQGCILLLCGAGQVRLQNLHIGGILKLAADSQLQRKKYACQQFALPVLFWSSSGQHLLRFSRQWTCEIKTCRLLPSGQRQATAMDSQQRWMAEVRTCTGPDLPDAAGQRRLSSDMQPLSHGPAARDQHKADVCYFFWQQLPSPDKACMVR